MILQYQQFHILFIQCCLKINEKGFKVSISGTSGDELFTGYYDHFNLHLFEMRNEIDFKNF